MLPHAAHAHSGYSVKPILTAGDRVGDRAIKKPVGGFGVLVLNDEGRFVLAAADAAGGEMLLEYGNGVLTPIVLPGGAAPDGQWPAKPVLGGPGVINATGDVLFSVTGDPNSDFLKTTYRWDASARQVKVVATAGDPSTDGRSLMHGGGYISTLNNRGEVGLVAGVKNGAGQEKGGIFLARTDGQIQPVALPDQELPDGRRLATADFPVLTDSGVIAFRGVRQGDGDSPSAYLYENGQIHPLALVGQEIPDIGKLRHCFGALANNRNRNVLLQFGRPGVNEVYAILRDGELRPVATVGQEIPGDGKIAALPADSCSYASESGEYAFLARMTDGTTAAYRIDAEGRLALLVKSGVRTDHGTLTRIRLAHPGEGSYGIGLNSKGQVVLTVQFDGGPDTLVLLTPKP
jgi:hypothetical protein